MLASISGGTGETDVALKQKSMLAEAPMEGDGKAIFQAHCASCHNPFKESTGPAMRDIMEHRSAEWVYKFLTDVKYVPKDSTSKALVKHFGMKCFKSPNLRRGEITAIRRYFLCYLPER